jgi:serine protease
VSPIRARPRPSLLVTLLMLTVLAACQSSPGAPVNLPPSASFVATGAVGPAPLTVGFDASGSFDPDGTINAYLWNFGNGATGTGVVTQHTYTSPGGYTARLTVIDDRGASASATVEIEVGSGSDGGSGSVAGRITVGGSIPTAAGQALPRQHRYELATAADEAEVVPGELIVKLAPGLRAQGALVPMTVNGVRLDAVRALAVPETQLYRAPGLSRAATIALARQVQARPDVLYAQPNYVLHPLAIPNDPGYAFQWHYDAINLAAAWDVTTGASDIVVAVVDSGILFRAGDASATHPDLVGKVLPGYDFVSDPTSARDGDGRDPDPFDEGFDLCGAVDAQNRCTQFVSSYHGSHVGGTIAAATNNGIGVAGVDWQAKLVPVRVLGRGGSTLDVIEGTLWAAGFAVPGVPANAHPAHVINMSLGGQSVCSPYEQEAFALIERSSPRRAIVVVAAGNSNLPAAGFSPASCSNVITVGATGPTGARAPYSNFGARIDVMAPGGDVAQGETGGVISLTYDDNVRRFEYSGQQGTSMAAPHVAGVVSLMKALRPALGFSEALALLRATARPMSAAQCGTGAAGDCGAGLIDAGAALATLQSGSIPNPGGGALAISPDPLDFGSSVDELTITLTNTSASTVSWALDSYVESPENPGTLLAAAVYVPAGAAPAGQLAAGATAQTGLGIDRTKVTANGAYQIELVFDVGGTQQSIVARFRVGAQASTNPEGPMVVGAFLFDDDGDLVLSGFQEAASFISTYGFAVLPGDNLVIAWSDVNANDDIDQGDYIGIYREAVPVRAGQSVTGIDFAMERVVEVGASVALPAGLSLPADDWQRVLARLLDPR